MAISAIEGCQAGCNIECAQAIFCNKENVSTKYFYTYLLAKKVTMVGLPNAILDPQGLLTYLLGDNYQGGRGHSIAKSLESELTIQRCANPAYPALWSCSLFARTVRESQKIT